MFELRTNVEIVILNVQPYDSVDPKTIFFSPIKNFEIFIKNVFDIFEFEIFTILTIRSQYSQ
ncbi:hypothetical protein AY599_26850 [Leptolyngbya valderiana BDU 20041]|nr:hypothetical protein AY599_26850 [Leptolyngbya valderiana BDU 20041]PPT07044.1 hypothetical protein CKA32_005837 [Geitlerinema sp. FC II]